MSMSDESRDLSRFTEDNAYWRDQRKRVPWEQRVKMIDETFPAVRNADWNVVLRDNDVFARLLRDILKVDQMDPHRNGPRPTVDYERGRQTWEQMVGRDFSQEAFVGAFQQLTGSDTVRMIARKTYMSKTKIHQLQRGHISPTAEDLRIIAKSYGKSPGYFAEYRAEYIMAMIQGRLVNEPEMTVSLYRRLVQA
jgi:hypothetical protein